MMATDLDPVFDLASIVADDEGGLHDSRKLNVAVSLMLPSELVQQSLVGGLGKARASAQEGMESEYFQRGVWVGQTHSWPEALTCTPRPVGGAVLWASC